MGERMEMGSDCFCVGNVERKGKCGEKCLK